MKTLYDFLIFYSVLKHELYLFQSLFYAIFMVLLQCIITITCVHFIIISVKTNSMFQKVNVVQYWFAALYGASIYHFHSFPVPCSIESHISLNLS